MGITRRESPNAAFALSLVGGIVILLAGVAVAAFGAIITLFIGGIGAIFGLVGVVWGILIIAFAVLLKVKSDQHVGLGVAITLFSIFSWIGSFGGFVIGFVLALVGGVLAITWKPDRVPVSVTVNPATVIATIGTKIPPSKVCPNCGAAVDDLANFCKNCGKSL